MSPPDSRLERLFGDGATAFRTAFDLLPDPVGVGGALQQPLLGEPNGSRPSSESLSRRWSRVDAELGRVDDELIAHLGGALPGVPEQELRFRWECASGVVRTLVKGSSRVDCDGKCAEDLERMLVPVIAGALAAGAVA